MLYHTDAYFTVFIHSFIYLFFVLLPILIRKHPRHVFGHIFYKELGIFRNNVMANLDTAR